MLDLDNTSVSEECVVVCMDIHYEDWDEDIIVYSDQGVSTEEHTKAMYRELTKLKAKKKKKFNIMWPYVLIIACHRRRKEGDLMRIYRMKRYMM